MNSSLISTKKQILLAVAFTVIVITLFFGNKAYAAEVSVVAQTIQDSDNDGISDDVEAQIAAQERSAAEAKAKAEAEIAAQQRAAEKARIDAEAEIAARQKAIEDERARIEAEVKAREEEIARKKAEEEAQKRFEESLTASGMSDADFNALCKIVQAEDGHDTMEGRIGIANVILNRVRSPYYPNTIMGVITAPGQFGPVRSGSFAAAVPTASTISAVKQAISGTNTVGNALYFHRGSSYGNRTLVAMAGAHGFFV